MAGQIKYGMRIRIRGHLWLLSRCFFCVLKEKGIVIMGHIIYPLFRNNEKCAEADGEGT